MNILKSKNCHIHFYLVLLDARVWVLDRRVFQQIMMRTGLQKIEENVNFLKCVPLLKNLNNDILTKIADVLEVVSKRFLKYLNSTSQSVVRN